MSLVLAVRLMVLSPQPECWHCGCATTVALAQTHEVRWHNAGSPTGLSPVESHGFLRIAAQRSVFKMRYTGC